MCTVTFLPAKNNGYFLTSNRDESALRKKANPPRKFNISEQPVFFPKDLEAGGTWIATGLNGFTLCLLNGAHEPHERKLPYRTSRGLVVLDFFRFKNINHFIDNYSLEGIEPFTLIIVDSRKQLKVSEFIWDANTVELNEADPEQPRVWSSVTLYDREVIDERRKWFKEWLARNPAPDLDAIMHFHEFGGTGNQVNDLVMNREGKLFTVSITSIKKSEEGIYMKYKDLPESKQYNIRVL